MANTIDIFVSPSGADTNPGTEKRPVATIRKGLSLLGAKRRAAKAPAGGRVILRGGTYFQRRTLTLGKADSGVPPVIIKNTLEDRAPLPTVIASYPGERAVLSGGRRITGLKETTVNGVKAWAAVIPSVRAGTWDFKQLWVNGKRAHRTRLPGQGLYQIVKPVEDAESRRLAKKRMGFASAGGHIAFEYADGDIRSFTNLGDADFVALHFWVASRVPFESVDEKKRVARIAFRPNYTLTDDYSKGGAYFYVENVFEALLEPGQWYLDRPNGTLYYVPRRGESIETAEVIAPVLDTVVAIEGASHIRLENLTVSHAEYHPDEITRTLSGQAVPFVSAAVKIAGSSRCEVDGCAVVHTGGYGIEITGGSFDCAVKRCVIEDLGAGGVKVFHTAVDPAKPELSWSGRVERWITCRRIEVSDCRISDGGYYYRQAVGVLVGKCSGVRIVHNEIHGFDYTGVSVGWQWGYGESDGLGNIIEYNHIYDIGRGVLSDMGGIYHLGVAPGTRIRSNHVHDVRSRGYGGWGIYTDEGSSDILSEHNLVHDTNRSGFHQHFGRRNILRNNIFAFGGEAQIHISRVEPGQTAVFSENNIFYADIGRIWHRNTGGLGIAQSLEDFVSHVPADGNLYYTSGTEKLSFGGGSFSEWRKAGNDRGGAVADPLFVNPGKRDFRLKAKSPALALGFIPFDWNTAGPRD